LCSDLHYLTFICDTYDQQTILFGNNYNDFRSLCSITRFTTQEILGLFPVAVTIFSSVCDLWLFWYNKHNATQLCWQVMLAWGLHPSLCWCLVTTSTLFEHQAKFHIERLLYVTAFIAHRHSLTEWHNATLLIAAMNATVQYCSSRGYTLSQK
jgi:hypothetical protein